VCMQLNFKLHVWRSNMLQDEAAFLTPVFVVNSNYSLYFVAFNNNSNNSNNSTTIECGRKSAYPAK